MLQVDYTSYQAVKTKQYSRKFELLLLRKTMKLSLQWNLNLVTLDEEVRFPFNIPQDIKKLL